MPRFSGNIMSPSDSKRHFTLIRGNKEHGLFYGTTPSDAALMVATKLCSSNKSKKVEFYIREITDGSKQKTYGPYIGYNDKLNGHGDQSYKIVAKLKKVGMKGGAGLLDNIQISYGNCGKKHIYSMKSRSKKCIILTFNNRSITIGSREPLEIQVKYLDNSSTYYKKEIFNDKILINFNKFRDIINELLLNYISSAFNDDQLKELIDKILKFMSHIETSQDDILNIREWFDNAKLSDTSIQSSAQLGPPPPPPPPPPGSLSQSGHPSPDSASAAQPERSYISNIARAAEAARLRRTAASAIASESAAEKTNPFLQNLERIFAKIKVYNPNSSGIIANIKHGAAMGIRPTFPSQPASNPPSRPNQSNIHMPMTSFNK